MLPSRLFGNSSLILYGVAALAAFVERLRTAELICLAVDCTRDLGCDKLAVLLSELIFKRLHMCGNDHVCYFGCWIRALLQGGNETLAYDGAT